MNIEELAGKAWEGRLDGAIARACEFFNTHNCLQDLKARQLQLLREEVAQSQTWSELKGKLDKFIERQVKREESGATGWEKVGPDLLQVLDKLPQETGERVKLEIEGKNLLKAAAGRVGQEGFSKEKVDLEYYFPESPTDESGRQLLQKRGEQLHFFLAVTFLSALYRLFRGKEVFAEAKDRGKLYCQRNCP